MFTSRLLTRVAAFATALMLALSNVQPVYAAAPANDNFASATVISALPFSDSVDITDATIEPGEPLFCAGSSQTVWYSFTPAVNAAVNIAVQGSGFNDTVFTVFQAFGPGFGGLSFMGCRSGAGSFTLVAQAGTTYYVQAAKIFAGAGTLNVNVQAVPPPPNDNFSNATVVPSLPFSNSLDISGASVELGEPTPSCSFSTLGQTAWYRFTPATSGSITASITNSSFTSILGAYTGSSVASLTQVGCMSFGNPLTFHANAGTAYSFQVGAVGASGGPMTFHLDVAPSPVAIFGWSPQDPSVFDVVAFCDESFDPGNVGFQSFSWDFGDGATTATTSVCPNHQYAKDGDYTVQHSATTQDGRSASTSQVVHVQTHDVSITDISAPQSANAGQTRSITVDIRNNRYPESVQVDLLKSGPGDFFTLVGTNTQSVPVRPANRTTAFTFNYTFTNSDVSVGKVTFEAIANINGARDAFPADNLLLSSPPTRVLR